MQARGYSSLALGIALCVSGCGKLGAVLGPAPKPGSDDINLKAKVRDFREGSATTKDNTHPHFNQNLWACDAKALGANSVQEAIDVNQGGDNGFPGDNRGPDLMPGLPVGLSRCFDPPDRFADWFQDKGDDVNRPFIVNLTFTKGSDGTYSYHNAKFFPIDNGGDFHPEKSGGPGTYGHLQTGSKDGVDLSAHNYGFTMELHAKFNYKAGAGQWIIAESDDDSWTFVNGKRVIDLGGSHPAVRDTVNLDEVAGAIGLTDGSPYPLDFFFAERMAASSRLVLSTNFGIAPQ